MVDEDGSRHTSSSPTWHSGERRYDLNSKIMLTAIISLSVVVLLVTILHIYARCVLRRQARRRAIIRQFGVATQVHSTEPPKTGLDPSVIASLPVFVFRQVDMSQDEMGSTECAVCLSVLEDGEMARALPNCKHTFHAECIDKWLSSHPTCPICRTEAEPPLLQPEPREPPTAPPLEHVNSSMEGTSDGGAAAQNSAKVGGSSSRLSSFRRMISRERSSRRIQSCGDDQDGGLGDLDRV
ncbi:E3 ubiquitin-protein ligase ATL41-like [Cornus florida]|uniref:E3 ubiquitin-protein ligase ATL41-like n=1 Tax=Cornus florida TaxID=4283 RepID=UPI0028A24B6A|nr:E3 ubiquitin-protein ligase ATL41-like [Cornus florida]